MRVRTAYYARRHNDAALFDQGTGTTHYVAEPLGAKTREQRSVECTADASPVPPRFDVTRRLSRPSVTGTCSVHTAVRVANHPPCRAGTSTSTRVTFAIIDFCSNSHQHVFRTSGVNDGCEIGE